MEGTSLEAAPAPSTTVEQAAVAKQMSGEMLDAGGEVSTQKAAINARFGKFAGCQLGLEFTENDWEGTFYGCVGEFVASCLFLFVNITMIAFMLIPAFENDITASASTRLMIAFQFGMSIFVLVYMFGNISGGHINSAVTWGLMLCKQVSVPRAILYIISQCVGATLGAGFAKGVANGNYDGHEGANVVATFRGVNAGDAFGGEVLCTFILMMAVLTACSPILTHKTFVAAQLPYAIGMAVFVSHIVMVPIDGCSINPSRSFGASAVSGIWDDQWVFWLGPICGASLAAIFFETVVKAAIDRS